MRLWNFTPHTVRIVRPSGNELELASVGVVRARTIQVSMGAHDNIPVRGTTYGDLEGLPPDLPEDVVVIVSAVALAAARDLRHPLYTSYRMVAPDTGPTAMRDGDGRVVAVRGLVC